MSYQFRRKTIGEILIEQGDLAAAELSFVLDKQKTTPLRFGRICVMDGLVSDEAVARALATQFGYEFADLSEFTMDEEILAELPPDTMYRYRFIPMERVDETLAIAIADPTDVVRLDELEILLDRPLTIRIASENSFKTSVAGRPSFNAFSVLIPWIAVALSGITKPSGLII